MTQHRLNELSRAKWLKYSISIWCDVKYGKHERALKEKHPAIFPVEIPRRLIETFTHKHEWVLDPFSGIGTTLVACKLLARNGIGIDISPEFTEIAKKEVANHASLAPTPTKQIAIWDDSRNLLNHVEKESMDFAVTSPPYWKILREKKTFLEREATPYTRVKEDLGNIDDYHEFLDGLIEVFSKVNKTLRPNKFLVVDLMDVRIGDTFCPLHVDLIQEMRNIGFNLWDIIIWDRHKEYNNLRAMIYPYKFYINKVHEYLLVFHKTGKERRETEPILQDLKPFKSIPRQVPLFRESTRNLKRSVIGQKASRL